MKSSSLRTGILTPACAQVFERQSISAAIETLRLERITKRNKRPIGWVKCRRCALFGGQQRIWAPNMDSHLTDHRIAMALGTESEFVKQREEKRLKSCRASIVKARLCQVLRRAATNKTPQYRDEWLWMRTCLKIGTMQKRQLSWITLKLLGPILVMPWSDPGMDHSSRFPRSLDRPIECCRAIIERTISGPYAIALSQMLSREQKAVVDKRHIEYIADKEILYVRASPVRFVYYSTV